MQRLSLLLTALAALPACTDESFSSTAQAASGYTQYDSRRCDLHLCILHVEEDSDGDGISDDDERAAGTDPADPTRYPDVNVLAQLMTAHVLPSFEKGNSLLVSLPTRDANGLPVFGGNELLGRRKTSLETAGIKVPDSIDISRGFTMSRTAGSHDISFNALFTAYDDGKPALPVRLVAAMTTFAPDWYGDLDGPVTDDGAGTKSGTITGFANDGTPVTGKWSTKDGEDTFFVTSSNGSFNNVTILTKNPDGTTNVLSVTTTFNARGEKKVITTTGTKHGDHTSDLKQETQDGPNKTTTLKQCGADGSCHRVPFDNYEGHGAEGGESTTHHDDPPKPGEHDDDSSGSHKKGYQNPEAIESWGGSGIYPGAMASTLTAMKHTIRVVQNDNDPLSNYTVPPTGVHDKWGPVALYAGDPDGAFAGIAPVFIRVSRPDVDPHLAENLPPKDAPPDTTCLLCYQMPR